MIPDKDFEDFFRNRLADFEKEPPQDAWKNIQSDIEKTALPKKWWLGMAAIYLLLWMMPQSLNEKEMPFYENGSMAAEQAIGIVYKNQIRPAKKALQPSFSPVSPHTHTRSQGNDLLREDAEKDIALPERKQTDTLDEKLTIKQNQNFPGKTHKLLPKQINLALSSQQVRIPEIAPIHNKHAALHISVEKLFPTQSFILSTKQSIILQPDSRLQATNKEAGTYKQKQQETLTGKQTNTSKTDYKNKSLTENLQAPIKPAPVKEETSDNHKPAIQETPEQPAVPDSTVAEVKLPAPQASLQIKADSAEVYKKKKFIFPSAFSVGLYFSPQYTFKRFIPNTTDEVLLRKFRNPDSFSKERFGYETGLIVGKQLNKKLTLQANLHYIQLSEITQLMARSAYIDSVSVSEIIDGNNFTVNPHYHDVDVEYKSKYNYIGVSANASYVYWNGAAQQLYVAMGGGINLLVRGKTQVYQDGIQVNNMYFPSPDNPFEQFNYRLSFSPGYSFTLYNNLKLFVEPTLHYFLGSTYKKREPIGMKPYTLGVNIGIQFNGTK